MADIIKTADKRRLPQSSSSSSGIRIKMLLLWIPILQKLQEPESLRRNSPIDFLTPA